MMIGQAAKELGVATHVLRHWEDMGLVVPQRTSSGYRSFDAEAIQRARMVQGCQSAGMSLEVIRVVLDSTEVGRAKIIRSQQARIEVLISDLEQTRTFLEHAISCRHSLVTRCDECSEFPTAG